MNSIPGDFTRGTLPLDGVDKKASNPPQPSPVAGIEPPATQAPDSSSLWRNEDSKTLGETNKRKVFAALQEQEGKPLRNSALLPVLKKQKIEPVPNKTFSLARQSTKDDIQNRNKADRDEDLSFLSDDVINSDEEVSGSDTEHDGLGKPQISNKIFENLMTKSLEEFTPDDYEMLHRVINAGGSSRKEALAEKIAELLAEIDATPWKTEPAAQAVVIKIIERTPARKFTADHFHTFHALVSSPRF